jgi:hypothetical protein
MFSTTRLVSGETRRVAGESRALPRAETACPLPRNHIATAALMSREARTRASPCLQVGLFFLAGRTNRLAPNCFGAEASSANVSVTCESQASALLPTRPGRRGFSCNMTANDNQNCSNPVNRRARSRSRRTNRPRRERKRRHIPNSFIQQDSDMTQCHARQNRAWRSSARSL